MTYSSAVFATPDQSLADAQRDEVRGHGRRAPACAAASTCSRSARGWGGFALYAAGELGCRVTTITISPAQHQLATERVARGRAGGSRERRAARLPRDRRHVRRDRLDRDAGGRRARSTSRRSSRPATAPSSAGRADEPPDHHLPGRRVRAAAARRELDPDLHLPGRPAAVAGGHRALAPRDQPAGRGVSTTSRRTTCGRSRPGGPTFLGRLDAVRAMGFDERFIRMWDYYLAISEAGFATGLTQDLQIVLEKGRGLG